MNKGNGSGCGGATSARLHGVVRHNVTPFKDEGGQRWIAVVYDLLQDLEPSDDKRFALALSAADAEALGRALIDQAHQTEMRDMSERN